MSELTESPEWKALAEHQREMSKVHLRDLFDVASNPDRFNKFSLKLEECGLLLDYSKNHLTEKTRGLLMNLARARGVEEMRDRMFRGDKINVTENRAVLHTALRRPASDSLVVEGEGDVIPYVHECLNKIKEFSGKVRSGEWEGYTGRRISDVVNIGIGGSDLGPVFVCEALDPFSDRSVNVHFVSNVDGTHISKTLRDLDPETTLFIITSKTFTTQETITNANVAKNWLLEKANDPEAVAKHFVAVSTNTEAVKSFGIDVENMFTFRDWVGGRYSLWSPVGLPICMKVGFDNFSKLLEGAHAMDRHFLEAPLEKNMPVIMAMLDVWYNNFWGYGEHAILPYDQNMHRYPAYLQQAHMESCGKNVGCDGKPVDYATGQVIFGEAGTNGQHSFYQLFHQGRVIPATFIAPRNTLCGRDDQHKILLANFLAQPQALMRGLTLEEAKGNAFRAFEGNRPSNSILVEKIDPFTLGAMVAAEEHRIFTQSVVWNIYAFDQWGVELGKKLANGILEDWNKPVSEGLDSSTQGLLDHIKYGL